jgi:hypothetical protein
MALGSAAAFSSGVKHSALRQFVPELTEGFVYGVLDIMIITIPPMTWRKHACFHISGYILLSSYKKKTCRIFSIQNKLLTLPAMRIAIVVCNSLRLSTIKLQYFR